MLRMMELVLSENPNDRSARYNVASLLMATGRQIARAARLAKGLYEENPEALGNAALYALALSLQGDPKRAADLLESRADLDQLGADGSAYYALVLSAGGRNAEAREVLAGWIAKPSCPNCAHLWIAFLALLVRACPDNRRRLTKAPDFESAGGPPLHRAKEPARLNWAVDIKPPKPQSPVQISRRPNHAQKLLAFVLLGLAACERQATQNRNAFGSHPASLPSPTPATTPEKVRRTRRKRPRALLRIANRRPVSTLRRPPK
jgi:tetratricopeptide (TPR) repeat protein